MIRHFVDDDRGYLAWLDAHPTGFVVNLRQGPKPNYVILHRADCSTINGTRSTGGVWTEGDYRKVCGDSVAELDGWAKDALGTTPSGCGRCLHEAGTSRLLRFTAFASAVGGAFRG
jgi:hypothetical protein